MSLLVDPTFLVAAGIIAVLGVLIFLVVHDSNSNAGKAASGVNSKRSTRSKASSQSSSSSASSSSAAAAAAAAASSSASSSSDAKKKKKKSDMKKKLNNNNKKNQGKQTSQAKQAEPTEATEPLGSEPSRAHSQQQAQAAEDQTPQRKQSKSKKKRLNNKRKKAENAAGSSANATATTNSSIADAGATASNNPVGAAIPKADTKRRRAKSSKSNTKSDANANPSAVSSSTAVQRTQHAQSILEKAGLGDQVDLNILDWATGTVINQQKGGSQKTDTTSTATRGTTNRSRGAAVPATAQQKRSNRHTSSTTHSNKKDSSSTAPTYPETSELNDSEHSWKTQKREETDEVALLKAQLAEQAAQFKEQNANYDRALKKIRDLKQRVASQQRVIAKMDTDHTAEKTRLEMRLHKATEREVRHRLSVAAVDSAGERTAVWEQSVDRVKEARCVAESLRGELQMQLRLSSVLEKELKNKSHVSAFIEYERRLSRLQNDLEKSRAVVHKNGTIAKKSPPKPATNQAAPKETSTVVVNAPTEPAPTSAMVDEATVVDTNSL